MKSSDSIPEPCSAGETAVTVTMVDMARRPPKNKLPSSEPAHALRVMNSVDFRDKSPNQIVPTLADRGEYIASEATMFRLLREKGQAAHRGRAKAPTSRHPSEWRAPGPNQVWSWDIIYLRSPIAGTFFYLYLFVDVWSRQIVGFRGEAKECTVLASDLLEEMGKKRGLDPQGIVLHQDNGSPMKGATLRTTMDRLGVIASFSRPHVNDDNPFSESLFRTVKCHPSYPRGPFGSIEGAGAWVSGFVTWYNHVHLHSGIGFVSPTDRHEGRDEAILVNRRRVYAAARERNPERWAGGIRSWESPREVFLNPAPETKLRIASNQAV